MQNSVSVSVRRANANDALVIQHLAQRTWPDTFGAILSAEQISYMLNWMYSPDSLREQMLEKGHQFMLAELGGHPVGYLSIEHNYNGGKVSKIHKVYILPEAQGYGIGRILFAKAEILAKENLSELLALNVNRENRAVGFYEHLGFQIVGREDIDIGSGYLMEDWIMEKRLN